MLASTRIPTVGEPQIVGGVYGAATVGRRILYVQAAPAALALILLWLA